jgi:peptidoglycan/xylan/chitin deacetylase (PgdA/CDA1 family)
LILYNYKQSLNSMVTIIMYHYVRDLENSRYPQIKGLNLELFAEQILYLKRYYNFITMEQLIESIETGCTLKEKSVLLTFDDAYIDHYTQVFPLLTQQNIQGSFFIPAKAVVENTLLDVNKIHFILASCEDKKLIIDDILNFLESNREIYELEADDFYIKKLSHSSRYDTAEVNFIKRILQVELDEKLRYEIVEKLFHKYVSVNEKIFSKELYLSTDQIKTMLKFGMHIGGHGYDHYWLSSLSKEKQESDISKSITFLKGLGVDEKHLTMCYPYGSYNENSKIILSEMGFKAAFTTEVGVANLQKHDKFALPRLDTNDIPMRLQADTNDWYKKG